MRELLSLLAEYVVETPRLMDELEDVDVSFPKVSLAENERKMLVLDYFMFEHRLKVSRQTALEYFLEMNPDLPPDEYQALNRWKGNQFSIFEVKALRIGKEMILIDLFSGQEYWVMERTATKTLEKGDSLFARVAPEDDHFVLVGLPHYVPKEARYGVRMVCSRIKKEDPAFKPTLKNLVGILFLNSGREKRELTLEEIQVSLQRALDTAGFPGGYINKIIDDMRNGIPAETVAKVVLEQGMFDTKDDAHATLDLVIGLWNRLPDRNRGGMAPADNVRGPIEAALMADMFRDLDNSINRDAVGTTNENERIQKLSDEWLDKQRSELDGKTPREAILEERKAAGNSEATMGFRVSTSALKMHSQKDSELKAFFEAALRFTQEGRYHEAIENYQKIVEANPENYSAWGNMGALYGMLMNKSEALRCLHRALSIEPGYVTAQNNLKLFETSSKRDLQRLAKHRLIEVTKGTIKKQN